MYDRHVAQILGGLRVREPVMTSHHAHHVTRDAWAESSDGFGNPSKKLYNHSEAPSDPERDALRGTHTAHFCEDVTNESPKRPRLPVRDKISVACCTERDMKRMQARATT